MKKISKDERDLFVKRKIVKSKLDKEGIMSVCTYSVLGSMVGGGLVSFLSLHYGESPESFYLLNPLVVGSSIFGGLVGLFEGLGKFRTKINYYDGGLYDGCAYELDSKIYNKDLFEKKLKEENRLFKETGQIINGENIGKKQKGIVYDDGLYLPYINLTNKARMNNLIAGIDRYVYLRTTKIRKTISELKKSPLGKLGDPNVESVSLNEGTGEFSVNYKNSL